MKAYRRTYCFNVNPIKGQRSMKKNRVANTVKIKSGRPTMNRRKDKDEQPVDSKTQMKKKYNSIWCLYCDEVGHNRRTCKMKK
ncbi:hypothetical protein Ahy_A08g039593 [Arachis hypogaea]|uniref:CCHC-type domain-containing protein n=1 Tax=Arachis hypogaea TaxID=3818 RepID=A0A445BX75_ARAHY|nr:hypothetical protein Ahy_A08g039593 [Arachis hypogaea]